MTKPVNVNATVNDGSSETKPAAPNAAWEAPQVLWEQPFRALLQASPIIGLPCVPGRDANCDEG